jgi:RNA polymerase sigma-70 factor (ECF subfamily)
MSDLANAFEASRKRLFGLAYRMLGSAADAEDVVQETYVRAISAAADEIRSPEAFFVTIATRLCLDELKSSRRAREAYVGPWLPEPIADTDGLSPESATELADDLSFALLMTLERLSPPERAAFLLRDVFDAPFPEIAKTLGKSEAACRQLASRARRAVREKKPSRRIAPETHRKLLEKFLEAVANGDAKDLTALLAADAIAISDGGGVKTAALNPIKGADRIARFFIGLMAKGARLGHALSFRAVEVNGAPACLLYLDGELDETLSIDTDGEKITAIYVVRNPEKLRRLGAKI